MHNRYVKSYSQVDVNRKQDVKEQEVIENKKMQPKFFRILQMYLFAFLSVIMLKLVSDKKK